MPPIGKSGTYDDENFSDENSVLIGSLGETVENPQYVIDMNWISDSQMIESKLT